MATQQSTRVIDVLIAAQSSGAKITVDRPQLSQRAVASSGIDGIAAFPTQARWVEFIDENSRSPGVRIVLNYAAIKFNRHPSYPSHLA
jgi:hypothetical protein